MSPKLDLQEIFSAPPQIHESGGELHSDWRIDNQTCLYLNDRLKPGSNTLETGAGLSTVIFAASGCRHTCITPDQGQVDRIQDYCRSMNIDASNVTFIVAKSGDVIYQSPRNHFDLILIDGCHGFPAVFVDLYYAAKLLKTGGTLIIDDMQIYTCQLAARFIQSDPGWRVDLNNKRTALAIKLSDTIDGEWDSQPFVARRCESQRFARAWISFLSATKPLRYRLGLTRTHLFAKQRKRHQPSGI